MRHRGKSGSSAPRKDVESMRASALVFASLAGF
jgi:hypothetical protein